MKSKTNYEVTCNFTILHDLVCHKLLHHMFCFLIFTAYHDDFLKFL
jgi:hypothetical protein